MKSAQVVFFGSGPVAAASLRLLAQSFEIEAVITKPRPAHHRGPVPVVELAEELGLPLLSAAKKAELTEVVTEHRFSSKVAILIDFGIIVEQAVIDYFPLGIINSHFSLLPEWRGADPITFSILSGQKQTGVSLMLLTAGMDEGPLLSVGLHDLSSTVTEPELTDHLIELSHGLLVHDVPRYLAGEVKPRPQEDVAKHLGWSPTPTYSRKLTKQDGILDFTKPAVELEREVRGFIMWPRSRTVLADKDVTVTKAHVEAGIGQPGTMYRDGKVIGFYTSENILVIDALKPAGKGEMSAAAFAAGYLR